MYVFCLIPFYLNLISQLSLTLLHDEGALSWEARNPGGPPNPGLLARPLSGLSQLCFESAASPSLSAVSLLLCSSSCCYQQHFLHAFVWVTAEGRMSHPRVKDMNSMVIVCPSEAF